MSATLEVDSKLTERYQTTVPESVRKVLKLHKRDTIHYTIRSTGEVVISRATPPAESDPVLEQFMAFLERDLVDRPERVQALDEGLVRRIHSLIEKVDVDLDATLPDDEA